MLLCYILAWKTVKNKQINKKENLTSVLQSSIIFSALFLFSSKTLSPKLQEKTAFLFYPKLVFYV